MEKVHVTNDEVNRFSTKQMAQEEGLQIQLRSFYDPIPDGECEQVLYDLDSVPADRRDSVLSRLIGGQPSHEVAVHSYNLTDEEEAALLKSGVLVLPRLDYDKVADFFRRK